MAGRLYRMAKVVSANPKNWGVVDANEISGFRQVAAVADLYNIAECILSSQYGDGVTTGTDAVGQIWHVTGTNEDYRLTNWANRKSASGWTKVTYGADVSVPVKSAVQVTGAGEVNILSGTKISVDAYTKTETSKLITDLSNSIKQDFNEISLETEQNTQNISALNTKFNSLDQTLFEVVTELPKTTATIKKHIYLVKGTGTTGNVYDEWIYTGDLSAAYDSTKWEKFGTVEADTNIGNAVNEVTITNKNTTGFTLTAGTFNGGLSVTNITYPVLKGATSSAAGAQGLVPAPTTANTGMYLRGDGTWATPTNTTYSAMTGATSSAAGKAGLVPAPAAGKQTAFLRGDGTWAVPTDTDTHYTTHLYVGATGTAANGATSNGATYLKLYDNATARESHLIKGTGATTVTSDASGNITINSTNTTYSNATQSAAGLMSADDKKKVDSITDDYVDHGALVGTNGNKSGRSYVAYGNGDTTSGMSNTFAVIGASDDFASPGVLILGDFSKYYAGKYTDDVVDDYAKKYGYGAVIIDSPYVLNDVSISGNTLTITRGNQSTKTVTLPSYSVATTSQAGLWKPTIRYTGTVAFSSIRDVADNVTVNAGTATAGRYYAVASDTSGRPFVNVPWTDNNTTVSNVTAADSGNDVTVTVSSSNNTSKTATVCSKLTESEILAILN